MLFLTRYVIRWAGARSTGKCFEGFCRVGILNQMFSPFNSQFSFRSQLLHQLVDKSNYEFKKDRFKTLSDVKREYGEKAEKQLEAMVQTEKLLHLLLRIYDKNNYNHHLPEKLKRMDRILSLMNKYENGTLHKKTWAESMQSRNMKRFFDEDFYEVRVLIGFECVEKGFLSRFSQSN